MNLLMSSGKIFLIVLQLVLDLFFIWRVISLDNWRLETCKSLEHINQILKKLKSKLSHADVIELTEQRCQSCNELLPVGFLKTHDGKQLCSSCKIALNVG